MGILKQCRENLQEMIVLINRQEQMRCSLLPRSIRPTHTRVQVSVNDAFTEILAKELDMDTKVRRRYEDIIERNRKARAMVDSLQDWRQRHVLTMYYLTMYSVEGRRGLYTLDMIAKIMHISKRHVLRHKDAGEKQVMELERHEEYQSSDIDGQMEIET